MRVVQAKRIGWSLFAFTVAATGVMVWLSAGLYETFSLFVAGAGALISARHPDNASPSGEELPQAFDLFV